MNQSENYQQNEKSFNASTLHKILYLEGSDAIFQITKGRKTKFFYRSFIQDFRELSMTRVSRFLPFHIKREVDRSSRIASFPARTGLLPRPRVRLWKPVQRYPGFFSFLDD